MTEAQRHSEVRRRFRGAWRSFCKSGGLEVFFAGLMAPLHPLPRPADSGCRDFV